MARSGKAGEARASGYGLAWRDETRRRWAGVDGAYWREKMGKAGVDDKAGRITTSDGTTRYGGA